MTATPETTLPSDHPPGDALPRVVALVGPTAVGKTALAETLARTLDGEIVSADSMQIYRHMDIGTAKPLTHERTVPYHCLDIADPGAEYSAAIYQADARAAISDIRSRGRIPIVVGGSGLYVRAALDDMRFPAGSSTSPVRERLESESVELGAVELHARLASIDPASAALIHPNNVRRTIRALEMADEGLSYSVQAAGFSARRSLLSTVFLGLTMDRDTLYARIDDRVDMMITRGLLSEVESLLAAGYRGAVTAGQAIGYKELVPVIEAGADLSQAVETIKQASRRYAKRQLTWFRADSRIIWLDVTELSPQETLERAVALLESSEDET